MNRIYNEHNRFKLLDAINKKKEDYFIICLDIIKFRNINEKYGICAGDLILKRIIEYSESIGAEENIKVESSIYEKDTIIIRVNSTHEDQVIKIINKIVFYKYPFDIKFRAAYRKIINKNDGIRFLENINNIIRKNKYEIEKNKSKELDATSDIDRYIKIKKDILENKEKFFYLVYQPKINTSTEKIEACEVLSRCINQEGGIISPGEFLPIIKEIDYQYEFDLFIFEKMCKDIKDIKKHIDKFSINLSSQSIGEASLLNKLCMIIEKYNINPSDITLEIVEDICFNDSNIVHNNVNELSNYGFNISIDDFGTGYSSYYRLATLNFSEIKIPKEFLKLDKSKRNLKSKNILSGIVEFGKKIECKVVSEGVENKYDDLLMKKIGVDYIQGYYYSKPLDKNNFINFILEYNGKLIKDK